MDRGTCSCGCERSGLSKRTLRRHMQREFGRQRPGRPRAPRHVSHDHDQEQHLAMDDGPPDDESDICMDLFDESGGGTNAVPDHEAEKHEWAVDARVADASIPCRVQRALDRANQHKRDLPVVQGGHLGAQGVLVISAILSIRFSFTHLATSAVLQFVGAVLPADSMAPCGAMLRQFVRQRGLRAIKFDMCVLECVVFRDAHPLSDPLKKLQLRRAKMCTICATPRLDPATGVPAHVRTNLTPHPRQSACSSSTTCRWRSRSSSCSRGETSLTVSAGTMSRKRRLGSPR